MTERRATAPRRHPRMRALAGAALAVVALAACTSGGPRRTTTLPLPRGPVLVLGDSIMVGARDFGDLEARLRDEGWEPEIIAEGSRTVGWALEQLEERDTVPPVVVVGLGSNPSPTLGEFPSEIEALVAALTARGATRVAWVPPVASDPERYAERTTALIDAADETLVILDWPGVAGLHPEWFSGDGLHLTGDGYQALAATIVEYLGA